MIKEALFMQWGSYGGGAIGELFDKWEDIGVFSYMLPFLIIFALVFGILSRIKMFGENRAINAVISLAVGLMALQFEFVPRFFSEVFPRLGIGLSVILVILILIGLFVDPEKPGFIYTLLVVAFIIALVVLINAGEVVGYDVGPWIRDNWGTALVIVVVAAVFLWIILSTGKPRARTSEGKPLVPFWIRPEK
jgi:hypothetical protein